jgi:hypothetical protein
MVTPLNANPFFAAGVADWFPGSGVTLVPSSTHVHDGAGSGQVTPSGAAVNPTIWSDEVAVAPGETIAWSGWFWMTTAADWSVGLQLNDAAHAFVTEVLTPVRQVAGGFVRVSASVVVPAGVSFAQIEVKGNATPPASPLWISAVMMYRPALRGVGTTPAAGLRYPLPGSSPAGDVDTERLAYDLDAAFTTVDAAQTRATQRPRAAIMCSTLQSLVKGTITPITTFDTILADNNGMVTLGTLQGITIRTAGLYWLMGRFDFNDHGDLANAGGRNAAAALIMKNGVTLLQGKTYCANSSDQYPYVGSFALLAVNDQITLRGYWQGTPAGPYNGLGYYLEAALLSTNP